MGISNEFLHFFYFFLLLAGIFASAFASCFVMWSLFRVVLEKLAWKRAAEVPQDRSVPGAYSRLRALGEERLVQVRRLVQDRRSGQIKAMGV